MTWPIHREAPSFVDQGTEQEILTTGIKVGGHGSRRDARGKGRALLWLHRCCPLSHPFFLLVDVNREAIEIQDI